MIEAGNQEFMAAYARGDAAAISSVYTEDGRPFPPYHEIVTGTKAIEVYWHQVMDSGIDRVEFETTEVRGAGDTAYEAGRYELLGTGTEKKVIDSGKYPVVRKEIDRKERLHRDIWNSNRPR